ncbi:MAG: DUF4129 domain-containing protein [Chloroflexi bacterium]|nr:DUF4129 domain-containing protein [Chloroflexota bacterium]
MTSATSSFERYFDHTPAGSADESASPRDVVPWNSWEAWVTLVIVIFVQLPVVGSLQSSNWVDEMPSLIVPALVGMVAAWVFGYTRLSGLVIAAGTLAVGFVTATGLVLHTMVLIDPEESGVLARWAEFRIRLLEWGRAVVGDGISTDPLPFVVLLVAVVFVVGFVSTWAVVRWRNPWMALIPGGIVLLTNISYLPGQPSFAFVLFLMAAILLVTRLTFVESLVRWRHRGMSPGEGMSLEVLVIGGAVAAVLILAAWIIPTANNWGPIAGAWGQALSPVQERVDRFGQLFVGIASKKPQPIHSMGGVLPLQGAVSLNDEPLYEVQGPEGIVLRGAVYDEYTGSGWRASNLATVGLIGTSVEAAQFGTPASRASVQEAVRIDVTVLDESAPLDVLLGAGDPIAADREADLVVDPAGAPLQLRPPRPLAVDDTYSTVATRSVATEETLAAAGQDYPAAIVGRYLSLPDGYSPQVHALAIEVTGQAGSPYEAARLIESHLRMNYRFSLEADAPPPGRDAVEHFLFESQTGYFDMFASSMAVMLRTIGVPSRVAVGFIPDSADYDPATRTYTITEQRAWSWTEGYFPGLGWVEFNPTPTRSTFVRPGDDSAARAAALAAQLAGTLLPSDGEILMEIEDDFAAGGSAAPEDFMFPTEDEEGMLLARLIGWALIAATVVLVLILGLRVVWERMFRGLDVRAKRWEKARWFASFAGLSPDPGRTPMEMAHDLAERSGVSESWDALARAYIRVRYGGPDIDQEAEADAEGYAEHYRLVRHALLGLITRRLVRFGRIPGGPLPRRGGVARAAR